MTTSLHKQLQLKLGASQILRSLLSLLKDLQLAGELLELVVRDSVVGTVTRYGLDGPGIESRWRRGFSNPSRPTLVPTQRPVHWEPSIFPWSKTVGVWRSTPTSSTVDIKERGKLYLSPPLGLHGLFWGEFHVLFLELVPMKQSRADQVLFLSWSLLSVNMVWGKGGGDAWDY